MTLLDRYLFVQFTKNMFLVLLSLLAIYLLVDFLEKIDNFQEAGKSAGLTIQYLMLKTPQIYEQLMPICLLLGGIISLGILNHNRELLALKAGGLSVYRIITPLLASALFFTILTLALSQWLLPPTLSAGNRIWFEEVNKTKAHGIQRGKFIYYKGKEGIYSFQQPDKDKISFSNFSFSAWNKEHRLQTLLTAKTALWENKQWTFQNGQLKKLAGPHNYSIDPFTQKSLALPDDPTDFFIPAYKNEEMSISALFAGARKNQNGSSHLKELHRRLSYIFLGLPLLILGIPILLIVNQRWGHDLTLAIPTSSLLAFAAWGWWSASQSMLNTYHFNPALASWSIHLIIVIIGFLLIRKQDI